MGDRAVPRQVLTALTGAWLLAGLAWTPRARAQTASPFAAAAEYSAAREGDAVLVFRHDSLVFGNYAPGYDGRPHALASGTKTFNCVIAALARDDGLLRLDEPVARTITEWRGDSLKSRITVRELLSLTSGLQPEARLNDYSAAINLPMVGRPGAQFLYGATAFHVFGELMRRKLHGADVIAYLRRRVFTPLGVDVPFWLRDAAGHPHLAAGAVMTPQDWGRFGLLLLDRGVWRGRRLVSARYLADCAKGSAANAGYGLGIWLNAPLPTGPNPPGITRAGRKDRTIYAPDLPHNLEMAAGAGGQRLYILPSAGLVVVRLGHNRGPEFRDDAFLRLILGR